jgi:hypothetical protein
MPVVNMGLHAALGLRFMLNQVRDELRPGDTVIIIPEYGQFEDYLNGKELLFDVGLISLDQLRYINTPGQVSSLVQGAPVALQQMFRARVKSLLFPNTVRQEPVYRSDAFNAQGDVISHLSRPAGDPGKYIMQVGKKIDPEALNALEEFRVAAENRGASVWFGFPAVPLAKYRDSRDNITSLCETITAKTKLALLAPPKASAYPSEYFFDTAYHLNRDGRQARTTDLIAAMKQQFENRQPVSCGTAQE